MMSRPLRDEARAWRDLPPEAYDGAVCELLDGLVTGPLADLLALASATLRHTELTVTESRGRAARYLLDLASETRDPALRARARLLVLLAWLRLGATIAAGPDSITIAPESPPGVILPAGAAPASITDPESRAQALDSAERHAEAAVRWNAKQRALGHVRYIGERVVEECEAGDELVRELAAAMSLAPGMPADVCTALEAAAG